MNESEKKSRYNLYESIFIFAYILTILIIVVSTYANRPQKFINTDQSYIACENGKRYELKRNGFDLNLKTKELVDHEKENARKLCEYRVRSDFLGKYELPENKNYTLVFIFETQGSYLEMFGAFFGYLILTQLLFRFIKRKFFAHSNWKIFFD